MRFTASQGRLRLSLRALRLGRDVQVLITGGMAHMGAVALAAPGRDAALLCLPGHREDELALEAAATLAAGLGCAVCVSAGIHYDRITRDEIDAVAVLARRLTGRALAALRREAAC